MNRRIPRIILPLALLGAVASVHAKDQDLDYQRLDQRLNQLASNPTLGQYAQAQRTLARIALQHLQQAGSSERPHALYMAERGVDQAKASAQLEAAQHRLNQLNDKHDQIVLKASQRDAAATRRELEQERLQNQLAQEETQRLQAQGEAYSQAAKQAQQEAAQARKLADARGKAVTAARHQADLAEKAARMLRAQMEGMTAHHGAKGMQMTLKGLAFAPGQSRLKPAARQHLSKLLKFVRKAPDKTLHIEGYTDSSGSAAANKALSLQRARAVRNALVAAGIDPSRIKVAGMGEANPIASNSTASGRAQNRRVVVILEDH